MKKRWNPSLNLPARSAQGYDVDIASPKGGAIELDAMSDPRDASGFSAHDVVSLGFLTSPLYSKILETSIKLSEAKLDDYVAIMVAGGQSPMFTFADVPELASALQHFYSAGKPTAALCHGTSALLYVKAADGSPLIKGKTITGFTNAEEADSDAAVGKPVSEYKVIRVCLGVCRVCETPPPPFQCPSTLRTRRRSSGRTSSQRASGLRLQSRMATSSRVSGGGGASYSGTDGTNLNCRHRGILHCRAAELLGRRDCQAHHCCAEEVVVVSVDTLDVTI